MSLSSIRRRLLHCRLRSREPLYRIPLKENIEGNGRMNTEASKLIGMKLFFQMHHSLVCGTMMAAFVLDAMPVNAVFQCALFNDRVAEHRNDGLGVISYYR